MMGDYYNRPLCAVVRGTAESAEDADALVGMRRACPYVARWEHDGVDVVGVYVLPRDRAWWIRVVEEVPELLGLTAAEVTISEEVAEPSPWLARTVRAELDEPPCGADCANCLHFGRRCGGCPAARVSLAP